MENILYQFQYIFLLTLTGRACGSIDSLVLYGLHVWQNFRAGDVSTIFCRACEVRRVVVLKLYGEEKEASWSAVKVYLSLYILVYNGCNRIEKRV